MSVKPKQQLQTRFVLSNQLITIRLASASPSCLHKKTQPGLKGTGSTALF